MSSAAGVQPPSYDPYGYGIGVITQEEELINGPAGELDDLFVPGSGETAFSAFRWLLAWAVMLVMLTLLARTRIGHALVYYGLALMIFLLLVTNYGSYVWALAPLARLGQRINGGSPAGGSGGSGPGSGPITPEGGYPNSQVTQAKGGAGAGASAGLQTEVFPPQAWIVAQAQAAQANTPYPLPTAGFMPKSRHVPTIGSVGGWPIQQ